MWNSYITLCEENLAFSNAGREPCSLSNCEAIFYTRYFYLFHSISSISPFPTTFSSVTIPPTRYESDITDAWPLGQPLKFEFSGHAAKNRFLKAAMTERLSSWDPKDLKARGVPTKNLINIYKP